MIEALSRDCFCVSLDKEALRRALEADPAAQGLHHMIEERWPHLFAALPVFVSRAHVDAMARVIGAVETVVAHPLYRDGALAWAPEVARHDPGAIGAFIGYDFHIGEEGPRLIEINTNAAGCFSSPPRATAAARRTGARSSRAACGARSLPGPTSRRSWCRPANGRSGLKRA